MEDSKLISQDLTRSNRLTEGGLNRGDTANNHLQDGDNQLRTGLLLGITNLLNDIDLLRSN